MYLLFMKSDQASLPQIKRTTFYLRNKKIKLTCIKFLTSIPSICAVVQFESDMHQCLVSILKKREKKLELSPKWNIIVLLRGKKPFFLPILILMWPHFRNDLWHLYNIYEGITTINTILVHLFKTYDWIIAQISNRKYWASIIEV